ncbi:MAG TPA: Asp-tRNA(Asn)/Glu-tRNA(Gln) amidotransferase subunit GatC [Dehalococcoidia bacterium]|nr:Asp-tRNA(Asn)/Glu-tRNA(Gln) amidotransferase subunit GatC [Dehalococcoidia bacterium]
MALTPDQVRHIARLARLGLTDADVQKFAGQLSEILDYFERLKAVDTGDVPPTAYPLDLHNIMRDDEPLPPAETEDVLANAPQREGDYFRVRAVLEE